MRDCFMSTYLRDRADHGHEDAPGRGITNDGWMRDKFLAYTAGSMLEAGSDTSASVIQTFLLHMLSFPEHLKKAQEELDRVVGPDRLPSWEDEEQLPYLMACIKESMRLNPAATIGELASCTPPDTTEHHVAALPHAAEEADEYKGYYIPKGATVVGNVYAIHMDPSKYPNPTSYQPERWYKPGQPTRMRSGPESKDRDMYVPLTFSLIAQLTQALQLCLRLGQTFLCGATDRRDVYFHCLLAHSLGLGDDAAFQPGDREADGARP